MPELKHLKEVINYLLENDRWFFYGGVGSLILLIFLNYSVSGVWVVDRQPYDAANGFIGLISSFALLWAGINLAWNEEKNINYIVVVFILLGIAVSTTLPMLAGFPWYIWLLIFSGLFLMAF